MFNCLFKKNMKKVTEHRWRLLHQNKDSIGTVVEEFFPKSRYMFKYIRSMSEEKFKNSLFHVQGQTVETWEPIKRITPKD